MSTPATGSDVAYTPDSDSEKYSTNRQRELYDELRKLVKKTEAGYQGSQALEMIIPKLVETYPEGRQRLKKKLLAALKDAQNGQADLQKDLDDQKKAKETLDEELRAASVAVNQAKKREAALQGEINDERNKTARQMEELNRKFNDETERAKQSETALIEASKDRERRETELQQKLTSAQSEVQSLADALAKEQELSERSAAALAALEEQLSQEKEEYQRRTQASDSKIAAQADSFRQQGDQARELIAYLRVEHRKELGAAADEVETERRNKESKEELVRRLEEELSIARSMIKENQMGRKEERETRGMAEKAFRQEETRLNDALGFACKETDEAQQKLVIMTQALNTRVCSSIHGNGFQTNIEPQALVSQTVSIRQ